MGLIDYIIYGVTIGTNLLLGIFVYLRNPNKKENQQYTLFTLVLVGWIITLFFYYFLDDSATVTIIGRFNFAISLFIPFFFYRFVYFFPQETKKIAMWLKGILAVSTISFGLISILTPLVAQQELVKGTERVTVFGPLYPLFIILFLANTILAISLLVLKLKNAYGTAKLQLQYLVLGFSLTIIIGGTTNIVFPYFFDNYSFQPLGPLATMSLLIFMSYAIVRHRLLDIRLVLARSVAYTLLVATLATFYTASIFFVSDYFFKNTIGQIQVVVYVLLALFIAFTFEPLKKFLESMTDRIFFRGKYDANELVLRLTKIMAATIHLDKLTKTTLHEVLTTMRITRGAFILFQEKDSTTLIHEGYSQTPVFDQEKMLSLAALKRMVVFEEEQDEHVKQLMRDNNCAVALPLFEGKEGEGILILGEKKSGEIYSGQDIAVLKIVGPEMSVAIRNAQSYNEISNFNITLRQEINKATKELRLVNERLVSVDKLKNEFVSVASHELRTPMTAIKSYLWMALEGKGGALNDKQKYYIERGYNSVDRLIRLVNDMLNISRIEAGRITMEMQSVNLPKVTQEVFEEVKPRVQELGLSFTIENNESIANVLADPDKIKEVLFNLIGNSLKFTPRGGKITISFAQKDGFVETHIKDTGSGIEAEDIGKLFQKFGLLPGSYTTNQPAMGTGLGLYICKSIISLHQGKIWATSAGRGKGSTFAFSLKKFNESDAKEFNAKNAKDKKESVGLIHSQL